MEKTGDLSIQPVPKVTTASGAIAEATVHLLLVHASPDSQQANTTMGILDSHGFYFSSTKVIVPTKYAIQERGPSS